MKNCIACRFAVFVLALAVSACDSTPGAKHQPEFEVLAMRPLLGAQYVTGGTVAVTGIAKPTQAITRVRARIDVGDRTIIKLDCEYSSPDTAFAVALPIPDEALAGNATADGVVAIESWSAYGAYHAQELPIQITGGADFMPMDIGASWTYEFDKFGDIDGYYAAKEYGDLTWTVVDIQRNEAPCEARQDSVTYEIEEEFSGFYQRKEAEWQEPEPIMDRRTFWFVEKAGTVTIKHSDDWRERGRLFIFAPSWTKDGVPRYWNTDSTLVQIRPDNAFAPIIHDLHYALEKNIGIREVMEYRDWGAAGTVRHHIVLSEYSR